MHKKTEGKRFRTLKFQKTRKTQCFRESAQSENQKVRFIFDSSDTPKF